MFPNGHWEAVLPFELVETSRVAGSGLGLVEVDYAFFGFSSTYPDQAGLISNRAIAPMLGW